MTDFEKQRELYASLMPHISEHLPKTVKTEADDAQVDAVISVLVCIATMLAGPAPKEQFLANCEFVFDQVSRCPEAYMYKKRPAMN